jgi:hypothetical protein
VQLTVEGIEGEACALKRIARSRLREPSTLFSAQSFISATRRNRESVEPGSSLSELEPDPKLHPARSVSQGRGTNDTERRIAESPSRAWRRKAWMIAAVEDVRPNLQLHGFPRGELFVKAQIYIVNAIGAQTWKVAGSIARHLVTRVRETIDIQDGSLIDRSLVVADSDATTAEDIGTLVAIHQPGTGHWNRQRLAGLLRDQ